MPKTKSRKTVIAELVAKHPAAKLAEMYLDAKAASGKGGKSAADKTLDKIRTLLGKTSSAENGVSQLDKVVTFLKSYTENGGKANSAVIRNGTGISREDWKATVPDLKKHAEIKIGSEKGQAKTYRIK